MTPGGGPLRGPGRDELAAAQQVTELFATEALLALDRFERSFPADDPNQPRQTADRLAHWWRELRLDDARVGGDGSDAGRILATAAELALDPSNEWGVTIEEATSQANLRASVSGEHLLATGIEDFRRDFEDSYGGRADVPPRADEWMKQSLTRLARAAVLRDVVALGVKVKVSEPLQAAADQLVEQGRRLMDDRRELAARQAEKPGGRGAYVASQAKLMAMYWLYSVSVEVTGMPDWAELALQAPVGAAMFYQVLKNGQERGDALATRLDPAQAQLRSVRTDLIDGLGQRSPIDRRDARTINVARKRRDLDR